MKLVCHLSSGFHLNMVWAIGLELKSIAINRNLDFHRRSTIDDDPKIMGKNGAKVTSTDLALIKSWILLIPESASRTLESRRCLCRHVSSLESNRKGRLTMPEYPKISIAVDAIVFNDDGLVLVVERGRNPGKGQFALPGGFVEEGETLLEAAIRETLEETGLDLKSPEVETIEMPAIISDDPKRDPRGRVISAAYVFVVHRHFDVVGGDDAERALWVDPRFIEPNTMFIDHLRIIKEADRSLQCL